VEAHFYAADKRQIIFRGEDLDIFQTAVIFFHLWDQVVRTFSLPVVRRPPVLSPHLRFAANLSENSSLLNTLVLLVELQVLFVQGLAVV